MSCNKAPGLDRIPPELLKTLWDIIAPLILNSLNFVLEKGALPRDQTTALITLLLKKGKDPLECSSYRPITIHRFKAVGKGPGLKIGSMYRRLDYLLWRSGTILRCKPKLFIVRKSDYATLGVNPRENIETTQELSNKAQRFGSLIELGKRRG